MIFLTALEALTATPGLPDWKKPVACHSNVWR